MYTHTHTYAYTFVLMHTHIYTCFHPFTVYTIIIYTLHLYVHRNMPIVIGIAAYSPHKAKRN